MPNTDEKVIRAAEEAVKLIEEIEESYARQIKKILDPEVQAMLEAIKMFHENNEKKLREFINALTAQ